METGDGLARTRCAWLLAGDDAKIVHSGIKQLGIARSCANAHVDNDFFQFGAHHGVLESQLFDKFGGYFFLVFFLQARSHDFIPFDDLNTGFLTLRPTAIARVGS